MPVTDRDTERKAIDVALEAERKAAAFYADAAAQAADPRGRDLLAQLARFEEGHAEYLRRARESLAAGKDYPLYPGRDFDPSRFGPAVPVEQAARADLAGILSMAIDAERRAEAEYARLAEAVSSDAGRAFFGKLAQEEALHEKVLGIEFYSIHNQGVWSWGD
jgi:rubrerythrin